MASAKPKIVLPNANLGFGNVDTLADPRNEINVE